MARISPGEPIHLVEASRHYLLNWSSALEHDHALVGATPTALLPVINWSTVHQIVLEHLEQWPEWVSEARRPGTQAYAVLAVCRAAATLALGRQVSKRAGADYGVRFLPGHAPLIGWARDWWYGRGSDDDIDRFVEVVSFVRSVTPDIVATAALPR
nr:aminoglycoside adenylyltransferase domain-containing protein [Microlunatus panaciterrae]